MYIFKVGAIYDLTIGIDPKGPKPDFSTIRSGVGKFYKDFSGK